MGVTDIFQLALLPLNTITQPLMNAWSSPAIPQFNLDNYVCTHQYSTQIVSLDPVAIYIENFINDFEIGYLQDYVKRNDLYEYTEKSDPMRVYSPFRRTASAAKMPNDDPVVQCIHERAHQFVGFADHVGFEALQLVRYLETERHDAHFDWFEYPPKLDNGLTCQRAASFFVYLEGASCDGGETYFPELNAVPDDADDAKFTKSVARDGKGLAVKPFRGNAMFWNNLHSNNTGDVRVLHSSLPLRSGLKEGMNILMKSCFEDNDNLYTYY